MSTKIGTAQSAQHRIWNRNAKPQVLTCIEWRNHTFKQMLRDGARIQYCENPEMFIITWPGQEPMTATPAIIKAEWRRVHLRQTPQTGFHEQGLAA